MRPLVFGIVRLDIVAPVGEERYTHMVSRNS